jgi:hypothetical protein
MEAKPKKRRPGSATLKRFRGQGSGGEAGPFHFFPYSGSDCLAYLLACQFGKLNRGLFIQVFG